MAPVGLLERMQAQDIADHFWEEKYWKDMQANVVQSALVESLGQLLSPKFGENIDRPLKTAHDYFNGDETEKAAAKKIVRSLGIDLQRIEGEAVHSRIWSLESLDRMIAYRQKSRKSASRAHLKRKKNEDD